LKFAQGRPRSTWPARRVIPAVVAPDKDVVALVGGDLAARARVGDAAARVGLELVTTTPMGLSGVLQGGRVQLVIIDLDDASPDALDVVAESEPSTPRVVGFYSHVDLELGQRARAAGIEAWPRGRFWRELSGMVARAAPVSLSEGEPQRGEGRMSKDPRPAAPSQPEEGGFEEGAERAPDSPEEASEGRYSTGLEDRPEDPDKARKARFSEGEEDLPDTPEKGAERRFSEGQEQDHKD
jgi:hypothetical protein